MTDEIIQIVKQAGIIMLDAHTKKDIKTKTSSRDFVTAYDVKVQNFLIKNLKELLPTADFFSEEKDDNILTDNLTFIIDPIDGTANFVFDRKESVISVALLKNKQPVFGVIYNPHSNELYTAEQGKGAYLNSAELKITERALKDSLVNVGTAPYNPELADCSFKIIRKLFDRSLDVRRTGSAAYDLCCVASGKCGLFFEMLLSPWDYAAGALIISEAGGIVKTIHNASPDFSQKAGIVAGNKTTINEFFSEITD